jgi:GH25 family lysozyme M1 (1,4-beta-N-acetylmuramidase)
MLQTMTPLIRAAAPRCALLAVSLSFVSCGQLGRTGSDSQSTEQAIVACAAGPTVSGLDVSEFQGGIDWNAVHGAGWAFAVTRIGDGTYIDPTFGGNWAGIKNAGMIRGAYQFFRAADDPNQLADIVVNAVGQLGPGDLPVMLDIEGASMQGEDPGTIVAHMQTWLDRVQQGTGKQPLIYTGKYAWDPSVQSASYGGYPLWIAAYGANNGQVPSFCPDLPMGWDHWTFWQYTSVDPVPGINANVDKSLFNGTMDDLSTLANGITADNCTFAEADGCGHFGCGCADHQCSGIFCPGTGCSAAHAAACGAFGCNCANGQCNGGTCPGTGCTNKEQMDCGAYGSDCVDHLCNGGTSPGTGCTWRETHDCAAYGSGCVDHLCNGGTAPGTGCTWRETHDCDAQGCGCVDHQCNGGDKCAGTGCTWRESHDCGGYGVDCADHMCSGLFGPGTGCTGKETTDCTAAGSRCVDHACSGGTSPGNGCTMREGLDCGAADAGCSMGQCVSTGTMFTPPDAGQPFVPDSGQPFTPPEDGGAMMMAPGDDGPDASFPQPQPPKPPVTTHADAGMNGPMTGGCTAVPAAPLLWLALAAMRRRRRTR